ncbi:hypothetical protein [Enterococcus sp. HY326]|uniref:hypothetical protein n=1 Tax=Enterococcus sp. HY326 TaxID=2971265 RepID=UPI00224012EA|nr:hypothetical protein [Enterococcus sp. HY326]
MEARQVKDNGLSKIMTTTIVVYIALPVLYYIYLSFHSANLGVEMMDLVNLEPILGVQLISFCALPYCAYLIFLMKKSVNEEGSANKAYLNLALLFVVLMLMGQYLYSGLLVWLLFKSHQYYQLSLAGFKANFSRKLLFQEFGGAILLLFLAIFIRFALFKLQQG